MKCAYTEFWKKYKFEEKDITKLDEEFKKFYSQKIKKEIVPKPLPIDDEGKVVANWLYSCLNIGEKGKLITDRVLVAIGKEENKEIKINNKTILTIKFIKED